MQKHIQHNKDERTQFFRKLYLSLYLKGFERVTKGIICERWIGDWTKVQHIDPPTLLATAAFLSRSPGLLNWGAWAPILCWDMVLIPASSLQLIWTSTYFLLASQFALNSTLRQSRLSPNIFDWMHLLFPQVHFFFWQLGRGQYVTPWLIR